MAPGLQIPAVYDAATQIWRGPPVGLGRLTSGYGPRAPLLINGVSTSNFHKAVDLVSIDTDLTLRNPAAGMALWDPWLDRYGAWTLWVRHKAAPIAVEFPDRLPRFEEWWTLYLHMTERPPVSAGQILPAGAPLGIEGETGLARGRHVHFGTYRCVSLGLGPGVSLRPADAWQHLNPLSLLAGALPAELPPAAVPYDTWLELPRVLTLPELEALPARAFYDQGTQIGTAVGELDARVRLQRVTDPEGIARTLRTVEIREVIA